VFFHPHALLSSRRELGRTGFVATAFGTGDLADRQLPLAQLVAVEHFGRLRGLHRMHLLEALHTM
jgi:hypothetical protein